MKLHNPLIAIVLSIILIGCKTNSEADNEAFSIEIENHKRAYTAEETLSVSLGNHKNIQIDSVVFYLGKDKVDLDGKTISLSNQKLGERTLNAKIYSDGKEFGATQGVTILSSIRPKLYTYKILESFPHDITAYTQGLEFANDTLYESTGQYGESTLRKTNYKTGEVFEKVSLPNTYFGE